MTLGNDPPVGHEKFAELCAMSLAGHLTDSEAAELRAHIADCQPCRLIYEQYRVLAKEGMPMLAASFDHAEEAKLWDSSAARGKVLDGIAEQKRQSAFFPHIGAKLVALPGANGSSAWHRVWPAAYKFAVAACFVGAVAFGAYRAGRVVEGAKRQPDLTGQARYLDLAVKKQAADTLLAQQDQKLEQEAQKLQMLQSESAKREVEVEKLSGQLQANAARATELAAKSNSDQQLQSITQERDTLTKKLSDAQQAYHTVQAELTSTRADLASSHAELDQTSLHSVSLQKQVDDLLAENREQRQQLGKQTQFLSADSDIRELMGARQLYIADVFDVSSDSRTRKPYGRVFYTKGKSLIFYAFDLDGQPGVKNATASTFQVWGKNESVQDHPVNLGVLYADSAANRRWVLRCDEPQQLTSIDAVFVTVESNAHGTKPTGKPFLYASLRKEPNHP